jgi:hypothetical protein
LSVLRIGEGLSVKPQVAAELPQRFEVSRVDGKRLLEGLVDCGELPGGVGIAG